MTPVDLTTIPVEQLLAAVNERYSRMSKAVTSANALLAVADESLAQAIADRDSERTRAEAAEQELRDLRADDDRDDPFTAAEAAAMQRHPDDVQ